MDLPDDFVERATEITDVHAANPVKADLAGTSRLQDQAVIKRGI